MGFGEQKGADAEIDDPRGGLCLQLFVVGWGRAKALAGLLERLGWYGWIFIAVFKWGEFSNWNWLGEQSYG